MADRDERHADRPATGPTSIIIFEMTMLGAILATVDHAARDGGHLPSRGGKLYDPEVSDGYILVGVENPGDASKLEPALAIEGGRIQNGIAPEHVISLQSLTRR